MQAFAAHDQDDHPKHSRVRRRQVGVAVVVLIVTVANLGIWAASRSQQNERAQQQEVAKVGPATAQVEFRRVTETLVLRCRYAAASPVEHPASTNDVSVSKTVVPVGGKVNNGGLVMVASGQPVFALLGDVAPYRDIEPMNAGLDVEQLQRSLAEAGILDLEHVQPGLYDPPTQDAVRQLWTQAGFEPTVKDNARALVEDARTALQLAELDLKSAQGKLAKRRATILRDQAAARLWQASISSGPIVPRASIVFVPELPAAVVSTKRAFSQVASGEALFALSAQDLIIECRPSEGQLPLLTVGAKATHDPGTGELSATVSDVDITTKSSAPGANTGDTQRSIEVVMRLKADGTSGFTAGDPTLVKIAFVDTVQPVLAVPSAALRTNADGSTTVDLVSGHKSSKVQVTIGVVGGGWVEVVNPPPQLVAGTRVLLSAGS